MGFNNNTILEQINAINGTQDNPSELISRTYGTQYDLSTLISRTGNSKKSSNVTPDKGHKKNLVTSYKFQKYPIHQK